VASNGPSTLSLAAGIVCLGGLAVAPLAIVPVVVLGAAMAVSGARRAGLLVVLVLTLAGVAGISVPAAERPAPQQSTPKQR
jgi:uncharacterized membrane protein